jgi:membrane-bound lytic murein transglycosylase D
MPFDAFRRWRRQRHAIYSSRKDPMTLFHLGRRAFACALLALGGCTTIATQNGVPADGQSTDPSTQSPPLAATETPTEQPVPTPAISNPAAARYVLPGTINNGAIGSIVVTNPLAPRTLDLTQHPDDIWDRIRTGFAIPNLDTPLVAEQQAWYLSHPDYLRRAVDRSSLYLYHVVEELNKRGMPTELALLPFVESAYNPMAYSRAHASGMWQFIPGTGKDYNLKQDWWRDERRDVIASTDAALTYLRAIYEMHGDWHLALASYNWGEGSVKRAIERNQAAGLPTDYLSLSMPDETRNYVPKLQALKNIIAHPEAFGVTLPKIDNEPYFVAVPRNRDIDMRTAARLANMTIEDFRALNPSFNRPVISGSSNTPLLVPADRAQDFKSGLAAQGPFATWQAHTVKRRETIEKIAAHYGMTAAALREVNGLPARAQPRPGQGLLVQKRGEGDVNLRFASFTPPSDVGAFNASANASTYRVKRGDTLDSIARQFSIAPNDLRGLNRIKGNQVAVGQSLHVRTTPTKLIKVKASSAGSNTAQATSRSSTKRGSTKRLATRAKAAAR